LYQTVNLLICFLQVNNTKKKFIGCTKWKPKEKNHRFLTIPPNVDLELLEMMFNEHSYHPHGIDFEVNVKLF
jgi:hypothetical protein